jgi:hypothetical protein
VVDSFASSHQVSTFNWQDIRSISVDEYSEGDMIDGYYVYDTPDPETGIYVSYPKFETDFGTRISFKQGIWNGTNYENRLKVINMPVLKSHSVYGVTATTKNYMGVQSEGGFSSGGLANGHESVGTGGMGSLMAECGLPTLHIIDAIWINACPHPSVYTGPFTSYSVATRVNTLIAGIDPIALDCWAANHVLIQAAEVIGYDDTQSLDPQNDQRNGLNEAFGVWLNLTKDEIVTAGYNVTTDENAMNVFVYENHTLPSPSTSSSTSEVSTTSSTTDDTLTSNQTPGFLVVLGMFSLIVLVILLPRNRY